MTFNTVRQLQVKRRLGSGETVAVGTLAQSRQGVFFSYERDYLAQFSNLSPFALKETSELQRAPSSPHNHLHGVFADCLPDGWGLLLQDRYFRQHGILPAQVTALDRLSFVGRNGIGALFFEPDRTISQSELDFAELGLQAQAIFDGQSEDVLQALLQVGSSGGARPKAQLFMPKCGNLEARSSPTADDEGWIVKFTSRNLPLGHEEGLCEAVYMRLAEFAELQPCDWRLLKAPKKSGAKYWIGLKRFDLVEKNGVWGRKHQHSLSGLLDADFRAPSLDYVELIKASRQLCQSPAVGVLQFRRAMFNLLACNQDDHTKNWAFLQDDRGNWTPSPFYDITFSPNPFNEHMTAFAGYGNNPPEKALQELAKRAGLEWKKAKLIIQQTAEVVSRFSELAKDFDVKPQTIKLIQAMLDKNLVQYS